MNKQDLDALANLYEGVYYPHQQLNETTMFGDVSPERARYDAEVAARDKAQKQVNATNQRAELGVVKTNKGYVVKRGTNIYDTEKYSQGLQLANRLNKETGLGRQKPKPTTDAEFDKKYNVNAPMASSSEIDPSKPRSSSAPPAPAPRPASPILTKKNGVEGTGVGANFKARAFTAAEKSRYASVAAQNAARNAPSAGAPKPSTTTPSAPKPPTPAIGTLGSTKFERRTPTSAELRAAQQARAQGASPEKALQAAQKTNLPTTGPTPAIPDLKSVNADLTKVNAPANINKPAPAGTALAAQQAQQKKNPPPTTMKQSYEWPSGKTIKDLANAYSSIYEAKKKIDQDQDGDNDFADVRIARMVASGVPKEVAIAKTRNKTYNKEEFEIDEATAMAKRGYDEAPIRKRIAASTGGGAAADRATALADRPSFGSSRRQKQRQNLARAQRGDFRDTTSSNPGLHVGQHKSDDPAVKAKQAARGAQRGRLTPAEKQKLGEDYQIVSSYLLENNFAETLESANAIIGNMSDNWINQILEDAPLRDKPLWDMAGDKPQPKVKKEPPLRDKPLWDMAGDKPQPKVKKEPPMRNEPLW